MNTISHKEEIEQLKKRIRLLEKESMISDLQGKFFKKSFTDRDNNHYTEYFQISRFELDETIKHTTVVIVFFTEYQICKSDKTTEKIFKMKKAKSLTKLYFGNERDLFKDEQIISEEEFKEAENLFNYCF